MHNWNDYFEDMYEFTLKSVDYKVVDAEKANHYDLRLVDSLETTIKDEYLYISFERKVQFEPSGVFELTIIINTRLHFLEGKEKEGEEIDWKKELIKIENPYIMNSISRSSAIIASITAAMGQTPLVLSPSLSLN